MKNTKFFNRYSLTIFIVVFLLSRLLFLKSLPIFNDEATYIDWGWRMINMKGEFFHSVAHYKPPLYMWVVGILRKVISNPLIAGRIVSVFAGFLSLVGIYKLGELLYNRKVALLASFFYTIIPLFLLFDRQALMESSVTAAGIWSLYFFLKLTKTRNGKFAVFLGLTLGLGYLIKTNAILFAIPLFFIYILEFRKQKQLKERLIINAFILFSVFITTISILLFNSTFWKTLGQNRDYIFTFSELLKFPISSWIHNFINFFIIALLYLNPILLLLAFASFYESAKSKKTTNLYVIFYILSGWVLIIILSRSVIPRHVISFLPIALIFAATSIIQLHKKSKLLTSLLLVIIVIPFIVLTPLQITSPLKYFDTLDKISHLSMKAEYVTYWSSGYGVEEVVDFLNSEAKSTPIIVGVRLDAGIPENAMIAYFQGSNKVIPTYLDAIMFRDFATYDCISSQIPVYFISRDNQLAGLDKHLDEIKKVYKPESEHYIGIYKVKTDCEGEKVLKLN